MFRIDQDGVPWAGDRSFPWAINVRTSAGDRWYDGHDGRYCHWNRGFQLRFENGWTLSVQWGWGNYCQQYLRGMKMFQIGHQEPIEESPDAEIAAWDRDENWLEHEGDTVQGYQTVAQVLEWVERVSQMPAKFVMTPPNSDGTREGR